MSAAATFVPDPGTDFTRGREPELAARLAALAKSIGVNIYGISGYRTPARSRSVGGFGNDPHTRAEAADIGVGDSMRASAARLTGAELAQFGLYRPFDPTGDPNNLEINHIQILPGAKPLDSSSTSTPASSPGPGSSSSSSSGPASSSDSSGGVLGTGIGPNIGPDLNPAHLLDSALSWLEAGLLRGALYFVLVLGGIGLAVLGLTRIFRYREVT